MTMERFIHSDLLPIHPLSKRGWVVIQLRQFGTTPYARCWTCEDNVNDWRLIPPSHISFLNPTGLLKHLMDHKLAGHPVPNESFELTHEWLKHHQSDTF